MAFTSTLFVGNREVHNLFQLLGEDEDSISLAIAWALRNAPSLLSFFLKRVVGFSGNRTDVQIRIHRYEAGSGITDIELIVPGEVHVIIEAKRGWALPGSEQLTLYARRTSFVRSAAPIKRIVTLSECSQAYAKSHLPVKKIGSIPIDHVAWDDLLADATSAEASSGHVEKRLLRELLQYLGFVMTNQPKDSNLVYVVSLASYTEDGWTTSWIDIVKKYSRYFHPVGGRWPKDPPNYMGFRFAGRLQSIHHVDDFEVIENLKAACRGIPNTPVDPHYLYKLGPAITPPREVKNGSVYPSGRVWCAIDTLLTCNTVSEARDRTQARVAAP
jgi:hypothetical protein